jgi:hypothetical protein
MFLGHVAPRNIIELMFIGEHKQLSKIKKAELGPSGLDNCTRSTPDVVELPSSSLRSTMLWRSYHRGAAHGSEQSHAAGHHLTPCHAASHHLTCRRPPLHVAPPLRKRKRRRRPMQEKEKEKRRRRELTRLGL